MSTYRTIFPKKHTFLAVIHAEGGEQALRNAIIAQQGGADGIFLINHNIACFQLIEIYHRIRKEIPNLWVGLNCLSLGLRAINYVPEDTAGLWVDDAGISEDKDPTYGARQFAASRKKSRWQSLYFGGVAFKYRKEIVDVAQAARLAVPFVDVITTSGLATGQPADIGKIRAMKGAIGEHPLAIASGITPENVSQYMPHADCFLVATGISTSHTELDPQRVRALTQALGN